MSVYRKKFEQIALQFRTEAHLTIAFSTEQQQVICDGIAKNAQQDKRFSLSVGKRKENDKPWACYIKFYPIKNYSFYHMPDLSFDENGVLSIEAYSSRSKKAYPFDIRNVRLLMDEIYKVYEEFIADKQKLQKIRDFKTQGILAKLNAIAAEDHFQYTHEQLTNKLILHIQITPAKTLSIDVPFKDFQEVMQKVRPFIQQMITIANQGISFRVKG
jgi:hypothetical protein